MDPRLKALERLVSIVDTLRGPGGCPWDRAQKLGNMARYIEEEASEVVDAIETAPDPSSASVCEELGDLLMNVVLAAKIAGDEGGFSLREVAEQISEKLVRRHPHVFAQGSATTVDEVLTRWNAIKAAEKPAPERPPSRLAGVPRSLPPLERAHALGKKAARAGFDWPDAAGAYEKVQEELRETGEAMDQSRQRLEAELGDLLLAVVNLCRKVDVHPSTALRGAIDRFCVRFQHVESCFPDMESVPLERLEAAWQEAKGASAAGETTG